MSECRVCGCWPLKKGQERVEVDGVEHHPECVFAREARRRKG